MRFWFAVLRQAWRNLKQTWPSQIMTLLAVSLSVLIFAFFYLVYTNMINSSQKLGDDLRLIIYLEDDPGPEMQEQIRRKIINFDDVEEIIFISRAKAYEKFKEQLGSNSDILDDIPTDFLPASVEVIPLKKPQKSQSGKTFLRIPLNPTRHA